MARLTALARSREEPEAFGAFYRAHEAALVRYFVRWTGDPEVAADLSAETFARAFEHRAQFQGTTDREAGGWLHTIARRQLLGFRRRRAVEEEALRRLGRWEPEVDEYEEIEERDELRALGDMIAPALAELEPATRLALTLRLLEELGYRQIAARLSINEPATRARVSRALRELRRM